MIIFIPYTIPLYYTGDLDYIIAIQDLNREFSYGQVNIFSIEGE